MLLITKFINSVGARNSSLTRFSVPLARSLLPSRSRENFHWISRLATVCAPCVHIATQAPFHETWGESFKVAASIAQGQRLDLPELAASSMRRVNARITQGQRLSSPGQWPPVSRPTSGLFEVNQGENRKMERKK